MSKIKELLKMCRAADNATSVSDVHVVENQLPWLRINGEIVEYEDYDKVYDHEIVQFYEEILGKGLMDTFHRDNYVSSSMHSEEFGDIRVHVMRKSEGTDLVIRLLNAKVPVLESLNLPKIIGSFADTPNGLYLFTGATGSGKSTALAALINEINTNNKYSIFTVEDPIEYKHVNKRSLIRQLAVGQDVNSFAEAIRSFLRADPDVILIGEMRDNETMEAALRAAETGHLVFATVHDNGAAETCQRILGSFEGNRQEQIKQSFATVIRGVVSLRLLPTANEASRVPAVEIMLANDAIRNIIRKGEFQSLRGTIQMGKSEGMQLLEEHLNQLVREGIITRDTALAAANRKEEIK